MARIDYNSPLGGAGWVDAARGIGWDPNGGSFTFTPGTNPMLAIGALTSVVEDARAQGTATYGQTSPTPSTQTGGALSPEMAATAAQSATLLRQLGLDELVPLVEQWIRQGLYTSWAQIEAQLVDRSTEAGRIVDRIWPELRLVQEENARRRAAGQIELPPVSITAVQEFYRQGQDLISQRGLTSAFTDVRKTLQGWLVSGKSLVEQAARLDAIEADVAAAIENDPDAMAEFEGWQRFYGVAPTLQAYVAHVLNPQTDLPTLVKQQAAVGLDRAAGRAGFGDLSRQEAEQIARWGVGAEQAVEGFAGLASLDQVVRALPGSSEDTIDRETQFEAAFGGNEFARRRIERRLRERRAPYEGGGGFASGREGFEGLGVAQ